MDDIIQRLKQNIISGDHDMRYAAILVAGIIVLTIGVMSLWYHLDIG